MPRMSYGWAGPSQAKADLVLRQRLTAR